MRARVLVPLSLTLIAAGLATLLEPADYHTALVLVAALQTLTLYALGRALDPELYRASLAVTVGSALAVVAVRGGGDPLPGVLSLLFASSLMYLFRHSWSEVEGLPFPMLRAATAPFAVRWWALLLVPAGAALYLSPWGEDALPVLVSGLSTVVFNLSLVLYGMLMRGAAVAMGLELHGLTPGVLAGCLVYLLLSNAYLCARYGKRDEVVASIRWGLALLSSTLLLALLMVKALGYGASEIESILLAQVYALAFLRVEGEFFTGLEARWPGLGDVKTSIGLGVIAAYGSRLGRRGILYSLLASLASWALVWGVPGPPAVRVPGIDPGKVWPLAMVIAGAGMASVVRPGLPLNPSAALVVTGYALSERSLLGITLLSLARLVAVSRGKVDPQEISLAISALLVGYLTAKLLL